jgi:hypothetical protein
MKPIAHGLLPIGMLLLIGPVQSVLQAQGGSYVNAVPNCGHGVYDDDGSLLIENQCTITIYAVFTSPGDVSGGAPIGPLQHNKTGESRKSVERAGGIEVYSCPGSSTPVRPDGGILGPHYRGEYRCRR